MTEVTIARTIAKIAHHGMVDKAGKPYFGHAARVANSPILKTYGEIAAGFLHDVLEDTHVTAEDLKALGISDFTIKLVKILTRGKGEKYFDYIDRIAADERATRVKLADIEDNLDETRSPDGIKPSLRDRYLKARIILTTENT
jgi:(p)ppGpp synthase/HD superfamily hydrolase